MRVSLPFYCSDIGVTISARMEVIAQTTYSLLVASMILKGSSGGNRRHAKHVLLLSTKEMTFNV